MADEELPGSDDDKLSVPGTPKAKPAVGPSEIPAQLSPDGVYTGKRGYVDTGPSKLPQPMFTILGADVVKVAAAPTMKFNLAITEPLGWEVFTIALTIQIQIDPNQRQYDAETREKLFELFGDPSRWAATTRSFPWATVFLLVQGFTGATTEDVIVANNFDLELAATKYFYALPDGEVPITFHFSGSIYYRGEDGRIQIVQVPWDSAAKFRMPVDVWKSMVDHYYPNTVWLTTRRRTMDALLKYKTEQGLPTFDSCISKLLGIEDFHQFNPYEFKPVRPTKEGEQ